MSASQLIKHFTIPIFDNSEVEAALNRFLQSHAILEIHHEFLARTDWAGDEGSRPPALYDEDKGDLS